MLTDFRQDTFDRFRGLFSMSKAEDTSTPACSSCQAQAVGLVTDEVSSRLRAVPGYVRRLRGPINSTFEYIDDIVERVPAVLACRRETFNADPRVNAFFVGHSQRQEIFSQKDFIREASSFFAN